MTRAVYAFEDIDDALPFIPLSARRVLDVLGQKLSLKGWLSLSIEERRTLATAGTVDRRLANKDDLMDAVHLVSVLGRASPLPAPIECVPEPDAPVPPKPLVEALGPSRPLDRQQWHALCALDRYSLIKCSSAPEKVARAYDEIVPALSAPEKVARAYDEIVPALAESATALRFSHIREGGQAHVVDVGAKTPTRRRALASARVKTTGAVLRAIGASDLPKGDVLAVARVAGLLAAKRTPELIPLCHPVQTTCASIDFVLDESRGVLRVIAQVEAFDRTGVEMEAMVAASVAALTIYDMIKSADRWACIEGVQLDEKEGGKSGRVLRPSDRGES